MIHLISFILTFRSFVETNRLRFGLINIIISRYSLVYYFSMEED